MTCLACGHHRDRHGPEAGGCVECRCTDTFVRRVPLSYVSAADLLGLNDDAWDEADYRRDGDQALTALADSITRYGRQEEGE